MEQFDSNLSSVIDSTLGMRCRLYGYQYSEIIRSLMSVYFCGGSCIEDVTTHLMYHLSLHPTLRTCSADTILRAIKELTQDNISYTSDTGKTYDFNTADKLNTLLLNCLLSTGQPKEGEGIDNLKQRIVEAASVPELTENDVVVTNIRHYEALTHALNAIVRVNEGLGSNLPSDLISLDLRECIHHLATITGGEITTDTVLSTIFSRFCVGK